MSQAGLINSSGTPVVQTVYDEDTGTATPSANVLNISGGTGIVTSGLGNTVTITQQNAFTGTSSTTGAVTSNVVTIPLGTTPGVYVFDIRAAGFDAVDALGVGYTLVGAVRTTGAAAVLIPGQTLDEFEENATIDPATIAITVSANNAIIQVTGVALLTIDWKVFGTYSFVS